MFLHPKLVPFLVEWLLWFLIFSLLQKRWTSKNSSFFSKNQSLGAREYPGQKQFQSENNEVGDIAPELLPVAVFNIIIVHVACWNFVFSAISCEISQQHQRYVHHEIITCIFPWFWYKSFKSIDFDGFCIKI